MVGYVPQYGDFISTWYDEQKGHEQKGRRPALVVSSNLFNKSTGLVIVCPVTKTNRDYAFQPVIPAKQEVGGVIMVDQVRSIDFTARKIRFMGKAPSGLMKEVSNVLGAILEIG